MLFERIALHPGETAVGILSDQIALFDVEAGHVSCEARLIYVVGETAATVTCLFAAAR
jgi:hypothetical protein